MKRKIEKKYWTPVVLNYKPMKQFKVILSAKENSDFNSVNGSVGSWWWWRWWWWWGGGWQRF